VTPALARAQLRLGSIHPAAMAAAGFVSIGTGSALSVV
jgi:hypothetical protein